MIKLSFYPSQQTDFLQKNVYHEIIKQTKRHYNLFCYAIMTLYVCVFDKKWPWYKN